MQLVTILAAMLGQCSGGSCSTSFYPSFYQPAIQYQPQYQPAAYPVQEPEPVAEVWEKITHNGYTFTVIGIRRADGKIRWSRSRPENVKAYQDAVEAAERKPAEEKPAENFGLDKRRIGKRVGYSGNVNEYGQANDSGKVFLTVIGSKQDRAAVVKDFRGGAFDQLGKSQIEFNEFEAGDWQVKDDLGFNAKGSPTILIQQPDGKVSFRAYEYGGEEELYGALYSALRKPDPNYRPERDPGPHNKPSPSSNDNEYVVIGIILFVAGMLILAPRRAK